MYYPMIHAFGYFLKRHKHTQHTQTHTRFYDLMLGIISSVSLDSCVFSLSCTFNESDWSHSCLYSVIHPPHSKINTSRLAVNVVSSSHLQCLLLLHVCFGLFVCVCVCVCVFCVCVCFACALAPRRAGDTVIRDVIRRTLYSPRQQKTRSPM